MDSGSSNGRPPRARVAVQRAPPGLIVAARPRGRRGLPPFVRGTLDQLLVAGPVFGMLSAVYGYHLGEVGWARPDAATQHIVRQTQVWHGHFIRAYFITPAENTLWWALAVPGVMWLVAMILGMAALGIRAHRARRRGR